MKETPQEYARRILGYVGGQDPLSRQRRTAKELEAFIQGASAARLHKRPAARKWTVAEILAHLADSEIVASWRIRAILGARRTPHKAFDQDAWVTAGNYERRDPRKSLALFRVLREANVELFQTLTPEQWKHHGMHAERGVETVEHLLRLFAGHDLNHTHQVEQILASNGP